MKRPFSSSCSQLLAGLPFDMETSVSEIMAEWPQTVPVFLKHKMMCIGCFVGPFHTLSDACFEHGLDEALICAEFAAVMA